MFTFQFLNDKIHNYALSFWHNCEFYHSDIESKHTSLKRYTNLAKLIYFSLILREREEKKPRYFAPMMLVNFGNSRSLHLSSMQGNVMAVLRTLDKSEPWSVCKSSPGLGLVSAGKKEEVRNCKISSGRVFKGQLNSEWIYVVIVSPKMPTKNYKDFCPTL